MILKDLGIGTVLKVSAAHRLSPKRSRDLLNGVRELVSGGRLASRGAHPGLDLQA